MPNISTGNNLIGKPSPWMVQYAPLITRGGSVLDLACGSGRHAIWLASLGYQVEAIDRDAAVMSGMIGIENINIRVADIEAGDAPLLKAQYDGIIVSRYLYRPLLKPLAEALKPGGVLIYETFMSGNERYGKPSNPDFLLRPDELLDIYSPTLKIIAFAQGDELEPRVAVVQRICAIKHT